MKKFKISASTLNQLNGLANQKTKVQRVIVNEWCKCTGMD